MFSRAVLLRQTLLPKSTTAAAATTNNVVGKMYAVVPALATASSSNNIGRRFVSYTMSEEMDPNKIFDKVDTNNDEMISRQEFLSALNSIQYDELLKIHEIAKNNLASLSKKLDTVKRIETHLQDLERTYEEKQSIYNNVGWETSADIDALFAKSETSKNDMKGALSELKCLIEEAKDIFTTAASSSTSAKCNAEG